VCGAPALKIQGGSRRCLGAAGECETKTILDARDSQQFRDQLVSKIAHLHSAELVDWAQRSLPIKKMLTPTDRFACHLSLSGLRPLAFAKADAEATAVLVDEVDASRFE
jgi:hypothetical protein